MKNTLSVLGRLALTLAVILIIGACATAIDGQSASLAFSSVDDSDFDDFIDALDRIVDEYIELLALAEEGDEDIAEATYAINESIIAMIMTVRLVEDALSEDQIDAFNEIVDRYEALGTE